MQHFFSRSKKNKEKDKDEERIWAKERKQEVIEKEMLKEVKRKNSWKIREWEGYRENKYERERKK